MTKPACLSYLAVLCCAVLLAPGFGIAGDVVGKQPRSADLVPSSARAPSGHYPWSLALGNRGTDRQGSFCNAVLIADEWAITTAHCVERASPQNIVVYYGNTDLITSQTSRVREIVVHAKYQSAGRNDIALIRLAKKLPLTPVKLPELGQTFTVSERTPLIVVGWWQKSQSNQKMRFQLHRAVETYSEERCRRVFEKFNFGSPKDFYCAVGVATDFAVQDPCLGGSGSALVTKAGSEPFKLVGFLAFGRGGCDQVSGYARIDANLDWIVGQLGLRNTRPGASTHRIKAVSGKVSPVAARKVARLVGENATMCRGTECQSGQRTILPKKDPFKSAGKGVGAISMYSVDSSRKPKYAPNGIFRYQVSLARFDTVLNHTIMHFCGGVLIDRSWVLTAAHCVKSIKKEDLNLLRLKLDTRDLQRRGVLLTPLRIIVHKDYRETVFNVPLNDIALIEIDPADVPVDLEPVRIASGDLEGQAIAGSKDALVLGWGKDGSSQYAVNSNFLLMKTVSYVAKKDCNKKKIYSGLVQSNMICAAGKDVLDSCEGDSGGPLLSLLRADDSENYVVVGIVSWGTGCGESKKPSVYARVAEFHSWIARTIGR